MSSHESPAARNDTPTVRPSVTRPGGTSQSPSLIQMIGGSERVKQGVKSFEESLQKPGAANQPFCFSRDPFHCDTAVEGAVFYIAQLLYLEYNKHSTFRPAGRIFS